MKTLPLFREAFSLCELILSSVITMNSAVLHHTMQFFVRTLDTTKYIEWEGAKWFNVDQDREKWPELVNTVVNLGSKNAGNFFTIWQIVSFSRRTLMYGVD